MCRDVGLLAGNICRLAAVAAHSLQQRTSLWSNPKWKCACESMLQSESGAGGCGIFTVRRWPGFPPPLCSEPLMVNGVCVCVQGGATMELENKGVSSDILLKKETVWCMSYICPVLTTQPEEKLLEHLILVMTHGGLPQEWPTFEPCHIPWDPDGTLLGSMKYMKTSDLSCGNNFYSIKQDMPFSATWTIRAKRISAMNGIYIYI